MFETTFTLIKQHNINIIFDGFARLISELISRKQNEKTIADNEIIVSTIKVDEQIIRNRVDEIAGMLLKQNNSIIGLSHIIDKELNIKIDPAHLKSSNDFREEIEIIEDTLGKSSVVKRKVELIEDWWKHPYSDFLAFKKNTNTPVFLIPEKKFYASIDIFRSEKQIVNKYTYLDFQPSAYELYRPLPNDRRLGLKDVLKYAFCKTKKDIMMIALIGLLGGVLSLLVPIATELIFDSVIPMQNLYLLKQITILLLACSMLIAIIQIIYSIVLTRIHEKIFYPLQSAVMNRFMSLPFNFYRKYKTADMVIRALSVVNVGSSMHTGILSMVVAIPFSALNFSLMFYYNSSLAIIVFIITALSCLVCYYFARELYENYKDYNESYAELSSYYHQSICGINKVRQMNFISKFFDQWGKQFIEQQTLRRKNKEIQFRF
jgi:ATP-binding cassette subfamily C protein